MYKKIISLLMFFFLISCGFTPMLKDFDVSNLNIQKINYTGKNELTYLIKSYINLKEIKDSQGLKVEIGASEGVSIYSKNTSGIATEEKLTVSINLEILNSKKEILFSDNFSDFKIVAVTNSLSSDNEIKKIERNNLLRNLAQKIKFRLVIISKQQQ